MELYKIHSVDESAIKSPYRKIKQRKSCPNSECPGGWAPDHLKDGRLVCPVCKTTWNALTRSDDSE